MLLNTLKKVCFFALLISFLYAAEALRMDAKERTVLNVVALSADHHDKPLPLHARVVQIRNYLLNHYVQPPKSEEQLEAWKRTRTFLRQPALSTIEGKPALCGELARLAIKVLKMQGISARRLYLYKSRATNHVLFEYYDEKARTWILMDSYASTPFLTALLDSQPLSVGDLIRTADPIRLVYDKYGYLPRAPFFMLGEDVARAIPYGVSWWYEEAYLIQALAAVALGCIFTGLWAWLRHLGLKAFNASEE